jgi:hypothetical protein
MNIEKEKSKFIENEIFALSIAGAFRQGRGYSIYKSNTLEIKKEKFRNFLKNKLESFKFLSDSEEYTRQIKNFKLDIEREKKYSDLLVNNKISFGRVQKLINLYLKYLWVFGLAKEPPHCPFDSIIISRLKAKVPGFANYKFTEDHYRQLVNLARKNAGDGLSISEWELKVFNENLK